ncbi:MAG TPA: hypothetical protein VHC20_06305 [Candidatus Paceibacterota bacterium]|nr:hypothetical protein [Candidatus Paceibacterota bacterium]
MRFPFILIRRSARDPVRLENFTLRDALREANNDLRRHRELIVALKDGTVQTARNFENMLVRLTHTVCNPY